MAGQIPLNLPAALDFLKASADEVTALWNFYSAVALGLLTLVYANATIQSRRLPRIAIASGFVVFATINAVAICAAEGNLVRVTNALRKGWVASGETQTGALVDFRSVIDGLQSISPELMFLCHVLTTFVVVLLIVAPRLQIPKGLTEA